MKSPWRLIPHECEEGLRNLDYDARLLRVHLPYPVLRFYSWKSPCVSYGYFQKAPSFGIPFPAYRRLTGGGIVFHDKDLTYSLTYPRDSELPWSVRRSYEAIHRLLQKALLSLGIETSLCRDSQHGNLCFENPVAGDLLHRGRKIAGAAQRRMENHLLHQGTILVERLGVNRLKLVDAVIAEFRESYDITFR